MHIHLDLLRPRWLLVALLAGCAGAPTTDVTYDFAAVRSYAWKEPVRYADGVESGEEGELSDFERRVRRVLERRDVLLVPKPRAEVLLSGRILVERRTRALDPNYSVYSAEEFEVATLTLDVYDRKSRTLVWSDREQRRLRTIGQRFGGRLAEDFTPTDEQRDWQVYGMVDALLARLPR